MHRTGPAEGPYGRRTAKFQAAGKSLIRHPPDTLRSGNAPGRSTGDEGHPAPIRSEQGAPHPTACAVLWLLERDGGAGTLKRGLGLLRGFLVDLLQQCLRRAVDEVLGLLEAEAGERPDLL